MVRLMSDLLPAAIESPLKLTVNGLLDADAGQDEGNADDDQPGRS